MLGTIWSNYCLLFCKFNTAYSNSITN